MHYAAQHQQQFVPSSNNQQQPWPYYTYQNQPQPHSPPQYSSSSSSDYSPLSGSNNNIAIDEQQQQNQNSFYTGFQNIPYVYDQSKTPNGLSQTNGMGKNVTLDFFKYLFRFLNLNDILKLL